MNLRLRLLGLVCRAQAVFLVAILLGAILAFGGSAWWARPALAITLTLLVLACLTRAALEGSWRLLRSPLTALGVLAILLATAQSAPWPAALASRIAPRVFEVHARGILADRAQADDPAAELPEPAGGRAPLTVDRSATLRWLVGAIGCVVLFAVAAHFADRLGRALVIWGSVVAGFFVCTAFGLVQLVGPPTGALYGFLEPGAAPPWAPTLDDALNAPGTSLLRLADDPRRPGDAWAVARPVRASAVGGMIGGPGAYLALGALALPLALGLTLQILAPRGSREELKARLRHEGRGGLVALMASLTVVGAAMVGWLAGPILAGPFALGLVLAGLPAARGTGLRGAALGLTATTLLALVAGVAIGRTTGRPEGGSPLAEPGGWPATRQIWGDAARLARDFPLTGTGLGSFAAIAPMYKSQDATSSTPWSTLIRWWVEAGAAGLVLLAAGGLWCSIRLPGALRRVGGADRALAFGLLGSAVGFLAFSAVHWTAELAAVALAACAVAGTLNRWLAGGTDLFIEPA